MYVNRILSEFDIDAALKRRPSLILVDELAHTNVPGSRHPKRYQDVEELLDAGIDVYTTVNIQHIESLNDVVAQITRVRVREIVPDAILDRADAIELVDLTPDDLIQRLKEGKVYVPKQAERALKHYFSPANLTALRELALRRTAERVDEQLLEQMQARAISGPWAAGERILVCVSEDPRSAGLVRYAKRLADRLRAPWTALYLETRRSLQFSEEERDRIAETLRLAERLDGEAITFPATARRIADDVLSFARKNNVTHIIIGKSTRSRWFEILHGSVVHDLVRARRQYQRACHRRRGACPRAQCRAQHPCDRRQSLRSPALHCRPAGRGGLRRRGHCYPPPARHRERRSDLPDRDGRHCRPLRAVAFAGGQRRRLALLQLLLPAAGLHLHHHRSDQRRGVRAVRGARIVVSNLAGRGQTQTVTALERVRSIESLYAFSRKLAGAGTLDDVLWATAYQIAAMLKVRVVLLLPENGSIGLKAGYPPEDTLDEADLAAAKWAWERNRPAGRDSDALPGAKWLFLPMRTGRGAIGILGIRRDEPGPLLRAEQRRLLDALSRPGRAGDRARASGRGHRPRQARWRRPIACARPC